MLSKRRWQQIRSTFRGVRPGVPRPVFLYVPQVHQYADLISGISGTPGASDSLVNTPYGRAYQPANVANAGLDFGQLQVLTAHPYTLIGVSNSTNAELGTLFSQRTATTPYNQIDFLVNADSGAAYSAGRVTLFDYNTDSAANWTYQTNSTSLVNGSYHVFAAKKNVLGSGGSIWVDGVSQALTGSGGDNLGSFSASQYVTVGDMGDFSADAQFINTQSIAVVVAFNAAIPDGMLSLWSDPERLLDDLLWYDPPAIVFGVTAAGGSSYSVAAAFGVTGGFVSTTVNNKLSAGIVLPATLGYSAANTAVQRVTAAFGVTAGFASDYTWSSHGSQSAAAQYDATAGLAISSRATHNVAASISVTLGYSVAPTGKYSVSTTYPTTLDITSSTGSTTPTTGIWTPVSGSASTWTAVTSATTTWSN